MGPILRAGLLAAVLLNLAPSAASAATLRVDGTGANGAYPTISLAVAAAAAKDTILVAAGDYPENVVVPAALNGLTITGVDGVRIVGASSSAADVVTVRARDVAFNTLAIATQPAAGSALRVDETGFARLTGVSVTRAAGSSADGPLVDVAGRAALVRTSVSQQGGEAGTPAVTSAGAGGVQIVDGSVTNAVGPALDITASEENAVRRSTLVASAPSANAVDIRKSSPGSVWLTADSSAIVGGAEAAGVRVATQGAPAEDLTTVLLRHVTMIGARRGLVLDATVARPLPISSGSAGSIEADVINSIIHEPSEAKGDPGGLLEPDNRVLVTFTNTDSPGVAPADRNGQVQYTNTGGQFTADRNRLFTRGLHLRADAPAVDAGTATAPAPESAEDIDGEPRPSGPATDLGADEFVNSAPSLTIATAPAAPGQGEAVTFTATASDPDVGDAVTRYAWDFGDGQTAQSTAPAITHAYEEAGTYTVKAAVADARGLTSQLATATVTVRDTRPPQVTITTPKPGAKLKLRRPNGKPRRLTIAGTDSDASGVARVQVALTRRVGRSCRHFTGRRFASGPCDERRWVTARLVDDRFKLVTPRKLRIRRGRYEVRARATDVNGIVSTAFSRQARSLVRFRVG